jgi:DNA replication protein DnaC
LDDADHRPGWYTGRIEATPCPICQSGHKAEYLWRISGLTDADKNTTIEDFRDLRGKEKARQAAIDLLAMNQSPYGFLTLWGSFGVGKSMLLKCLVNGFRLIGLLAHYTTLADLLATVREKFGEGSGSVEAAIDYYRAIPVLAMDEIDRVNMTPWATETTYRLLDSRFNSRDELVTVIACNLSPLQLPAEFGYLASRMRGGQVVEVGGADLRPAIALKERKDIDG